MSSDLPEPPSYGRPNLDLIKRMYETPSEEDGPFYAVNLMRYRERAEYRDGRETSLSGREADDEYSPIEILNDLDAEVVFVGDVVDQFAGDGVAWDRIGIVRYPTRRSMIEMNMREDFQKIHAHKEAGMAETIVMLCNTDDAPSGPGLRDREAILAAEGEGAVVLMDVSQLLEGANAPASVGLRPEIFLDVEGVIIGDGREWNHVRLTRFESMSDYESVTLQPKWKMAEDAMTDVSADRYSICIDAKIDWWTGS